MAIPKFAAPAGNFHLELKRRIQEYFATTGKNTTGGSKLIFKGAFLFVLFASLYIHLVWFTPSAILSIIECAILGIAISCIGFNVMHDGAHGSFSRHKWINYLAAFSLNILGGNSFMWN